METQTAISRLTDSNIETKIAISRVTDSNIKIAKILDVAVSDIQIKTSLLASF